jgi:hypothetical protein
MASTSNWRTSRLSRPATGNRRGLIPSHRWELRIGELRVYYEVKDEPDPVVTVLAVGVKERNVIRIGGEEVDL